MRATAWFIATGLVAALAGATTVPAHAVVDRPFPIVTVTGEGRVSVQPDLAHVAAGVTNEAKTPREASEANAASMNAVIAALKNAGIEAADIRTSRFSISPVYSQRQREGQPQVSGYRAANQVRATVRDLGRVGDVLERLIAAGATNVGGVDFSVSEPSKLMDEARKAAFADAKRKAGMFAQEAGAQLGRAVSIAEDEAQPPRAFALGAPVAARAMPAPPPVQVGEDVLRVQVTVSFELNH